MCLFNSLYISRKFPLVRVQFNHSLLAPLHLSEPVLVCPWTHLGMQWLSQEYQTVLWPPPSVKLLQLLHWGWENLNYFNLTTTQGGGKWTLHGYLLSLNLVDQISFALLHWIVLGMWPDSMYTCTIHLNEFMLIAISLQSDQRCVTLFIGGK